MLRFEPNPVINRLTRGLAAEVLETFHSVYIGGIEFGHYYQITPPGEKEIWRWGLQFPVASDPTGIDESECAARATFNFYYEELLRATGLAEIPVAPAAP